MPSAGVRECLHAEDIIKVEAHNEQPHHRLRKHFSGYSHERIVCGHLHELLSRLLLQFGTQRVSRDEKHEQQHTRRHEHRGEINVIVHPRVTHGVRVEHDGLQERHYLTVRISLGGHHLLAYGCRTERSHCLQVLEHQRSCGQRGVAVIIRYGGLA